jgi:tripartite-type tricarboxylate transporter receptor subunit TctC
MQKVVILRELACRAAMATALMVGALWPSVGAAQTYPSRSVTVVVPSAPGTGIDSLARLSMEQLQSALGRPFVADNQPGAGQQIALAAAMRAPPDGHTLLVATSGLMAIGPAYFKKLSIDTVNSLVPISIYAKAPFVLVVDPKLEARSLPALLKLAKESPKPLSFSSPSVASTGHLIMEVTAQRAGVKFTHVPYRNNIQALTDVMGGTVNASFAEAASVLQLIQTNKLRALAVSSTARLASLPDVPTLGEALNDPKFEAVAWHGLFALPGTPEAVVSKLRGQMGSVAASPAFRKSATDQGLVPLDATDVETMRSYIKAEQVRWGTLVRSLGLEGPP